MGKYSNTFKLIISINGNKLENTNSSSLCMHKQFSESTKTQTFLFIKQ